MTLLLFIIVIGLFIWISHLNERISSVEKKLSSTATLGKLPPLSEQSVTTQQNQTVTHSASLQQPALVTEESPDLPTTIQPIPAEQHTDAEVEAIFTVSWLSKIGIIAVALGVAFFFKYAIDQGWIGPWLRVIIGVFVGLGLMYLGILWRLKYGNRAYALIGGGIAILYFSMYAAYQFYGLIPHAVAILLCVIIASSAVWFSVNYNSFGLAILGFFGAYAAPLLLSSPTDHQIELFVYLSLLNIIVCAMLFKKYWLELLFLGLIGTIIDFIIWGASHSTASNVFPSLYFVVVTTIVSIAGTAAVIRFHNQKKILPKNASTNAALVAVSAGLFYISSIFFLLNDAYHTLLAPLAALGGIIFFATYVIIDRLELAECNYALAGFGSLLLVYAAGWQWHGRLLGLMWLILGLIGVLAGSYFKRKEISFYGLLVLLVSACKSIIEPYTGADTAFLFNTKFGLLFIEVLSGMYISYVYKAQSGMRTLSEGLRIIASLLLWFAVSWDIINFFQGNTAVNARNLSLSFWWVVFAIILLITGSILHSPAFRKIALGLFCLSIIKVFLYDAQALDTGYRIIAFIVLGILLLTVSFMYQHNKGKVSKFLQNTLPETEKL